MPRTRRLDLAGVAQHIVQRGNNRQACFPGRSDYLRYLQCLRDAAGERECSIHAYVLMTNHVHLLATPQTRGAVGLMMQDIGRRFVRAINESTGRSGTLWEGRYKSCLVDSEHYLLTCYRYIELNPVRAGMVAEPADYEWSSYIGNAGIAGDLLLSPHPIFTRLGRRDEERQAHYRKLVADGVSDEQLARIRMITQRQRAFGSDAFLKAVEERTGQRAGLGTPGRRRKVESEAEKVV